MVEELKRTRKDSLLDLTVSNPISVGITWDPELLQSALAKTPAWLQWNPDACGSRAAREAVGRYEQARSLPCDPEDYILTASTSEAYSILFKVLCNPGDAILVPRPGYPLLDVLSSLDHLECVGYSLQADHGWALDWRSLESAPDHTKAILVVDPNNPTGSLLSPSDWLRLTQLCKVRNWAMIVDQVFSDFPLQPLPSVVWTGIASQVPLFRLNGMSKSFGLPQAKLSWIWFGCPQVHRKELQNALEFVADAYLNLSALTESLLVALVPQQGSFREQVLARMQTNLSEANRALLGIADLFYPPQGGWYCCAHFDGWDDETLALQLATQHGVLVQPGFFFDFAEDGWIVFSLLAEPSVFSQGVSYLAQVVRCR